MVIGAGILGGAVTRLSGAPSDSTGVPLPWNRKPTSWAIDIAPADEPGARMVISGRVLGKDDVPLPSITMYAYHADANGRYWREGDPPNVNRLGGVLRTNAAGEYLIRTIVPGQYEGAPHIHYELWGPGVRWCVGHVDLYPDPSVPDLPIWRTRVQARRAWSHSMALVWLDSTGVYHAQFDVRVSATVPASSELDSLRRAIDQSYERWHR
jgi:protocatechuate 3,4-dioxygenase beta subunit